MHRRRYRSRSGSKNSLDSECSSDYHSDYSKKSRSRSRSRSRSTDSGYRLHIADIAEGVKKSDIEHIFEEFGNLKEIWMANSPPCFGFAVFKNKSNAMAALKGTDGLMLCGGRIRVTHARPRTKGLGRRFYNPNMRCYECGVPGHFYRDCPDLYNGGYNYSKHSSRHRYSSYRYMSKRRYMDRDRGDRDRDNRDSSKHGTGGGGGGGGSGGGGGGDRRHYSEERDRDRSPDSRRRRR